MLEHKNTNVMNTKVSVEKVDLLHFDPFNPNGKQPVADARRTGGVHAYPDCPGKLSE